METLSAPGIYIEQLQPLRIAGELLRSDITAFIGYARQGPANLPVRVESWQQFLAVFGLPLPDGHLALAVKAFFENGGANCYIHRLTDGSQQEARVELEDQSGTGSAPWRFFASFRVGDIAASERGESTRPDSAVLHHIAPGASRKPVPNPGAWGNALAVSVTPNSRLSTATNGFFDEGYSTWVDSLVGLEPHSIVRLIQTGTDGVSLSPPKYVAIKSIDRFHQSVTWAESLLETFSAEQPVRIDTVEFDITVFFESRQVEHFEWLSPHPEHSRSLHRILAEQSHYLSLTYLAGLEQNWLDEALWPQPTTHQPTTQTNLSQGQDGLAGIRATHYLDALAMLGKVEEVAIVAAPDLVLNAQDSTERVSQNIPVPVDCKALLPPSKGVIFGCVTDGAQPLYGVTVTDAGSGRRVVTDGDGLFHLEGLNISLRTLRLEKPGYMKEERQIFAFAALSPEPEIFTLTPLALPRALTELEILEVQKALLNPAILGPYRVALLDPPKPALRIDQIRSWRSQVGDSAFGALFYPWLEAPSALANDSRLFAVPPCGHVAALLARMDIEYGPHRAPANIKLRFAKRALTVVNEVEHGLINAEGINLIRSLHGQGIRILGARTLSSDPEWRYFNVRRLVLALEKTLERALQWAVFESNTPVLRQAITLSITTLLNRLWRNGALAGKTAAGAYQVKCDNDNNPAAQRDRGQVLAEVLIAPSVPFEFIRIRFGKTLDAIEVTE